MSTLGRILSVQIGRVQKFDGGGDVAESWSSAIGKVEVSGVVEVGKMGLTDDEQADLVNHGGADKAVLAYASEHYEKWNEEFPGKNFQAGGFGENLTVADLNESICCIGDIFRVGDCRLQVSQPRQPCWKLSGRWELPKLAVLVQQNGRTGWYLRVLEDGKIEAGMQIELIARPFPEISVKMAHAVMYAKPRRHDDDQWLAKCPALSEAWRTNLEQRSRTASSN